MLGQISRGLWLTVLALLGQGLYLGCSTGDESARTEPVASVQQAFPVFTCKCVTAKGDKAEAVCLDTCFKTAKCGDAEESCGSVCKYETYSDETGQKCGGWDYNVKEEYIGQCAKSGVLPQDRPGCCPACITADGVCGGVNNPAACGTGGECKACEDNNPNDCWLPACKEGKCIGDEVPAPVGDACETAEGARGRCGDRGVCCTGCLTPGGGCLEGTAAGACGRDGVACNDCSDGQACNGAEQCNAGSCVAGSPLGCDDNNPCTVDTCDNATGCKNDIDVTLPCSDGDGCTIDDQCHGDGSCAGTPITCDDGNDCTDDSCSEGRCEFVPANDTEPCEDGSSCTLVTTCNAGECVSSAPEVCHDTSNPCKTSSCGDDGLGTCTEINREDDTPCDDNNPCTTGDSCQAGVCTGGGDTDCDDNNPCTNDSCDDVTGCSYENGTGECADGNLCTVDDRCEDGKCVGEAVGCPAANECTQSGQCDEGSGLCSLLLVEDGTECGNGGECDAGQCVNEDEPVGSGGTAGNGGTAGFGGTNGSGGTTSNAGAAGESGDDGAGGSNTSSGGSGGSGGSGTDAGGSGGSSAQGGTSGMGGAGGTTAAGGSSLGGSGGEDAGSAGTYAGDDFQRDAKGCDCRTAPGGAPPSSAGIGALGLGAMLAGRLRRRKRAR